MSVINSHYYYYYCYYHHFFLVRGNKQLLELVTLFNAGSLSNPRSLFPANVSGEGCFQLGRAALLFQCSLTAEKPVTIL